MGSGCLSGSRFFQQVCILWVIVAVWFSRSIERRVVWCWPSSRVNDASVTSGVGIDGVVPDKMFSRSIIVFPVRGMSSRVIR